MYKFLVLLLAVIILAACNADNHEDYNTLPAVTVSVDTGKVIEAADDQPIYVEITESEVPVDDAEVEIELWRAVDDEKSAEKYKLLHDEGIYAAAIDIREEGLYYEKANVISGDITAAPIKYFSVGDLTHEEHIILESLGAHDSENHEGHH